MTNDYFNIIYRTEFGNFKIIHLSYIFIVNLKYKINLACLEKKITDIGEGRVRWAISSELSVIYGYIRFSLELKLTNCKYNYITHHSKSP